MDENTFWLYETFNRLEAVAWFVIALVLPFRIARRTPRQNLSVFTASAAFVAFGITDLLEAPTHGNLPAWLWAAKIVCAATLLSCRYHYLGWHTFRLSDRYLIVAILCLTASILAMALPWLLERILT